MEEYSSVSEPQRLALHAAVRRTLGEEEGDTLMALSPPANTDIATRQDVDVLRTEMTGEFAALRAEMHTGLALVEQRMQAFTWKVVVGTAVALYVAITGTLFGGAALLLQALERA